MKINWSLLLFVFLVLGSCEFLKRITDTETPNTPDVTVVEPDEEKTEPKKEIKTEAALRSNIVENSKRYVGVKYKYAGKQPNTGFDCSGFTSYCYGRYEKSLSPSSSMQSTQGKKVPLDKVKPGDLIFFSRDKKKVFHVAMVVSNTSEGITVIHSTSSRGVMIQNISKSSYWQPKIFFARDVLSGQ